jgi:hypothetical protein
MMPFFLLYGALTHQVFAHTYMGSHRHAFTVGFINMMILGVCLAGHCSDEDFLPLNDSIFYDAVAPQMTANQEGAVKALYATGTPEFWIAAAHANGIYVF